MKIEYNYLDFYSQFDKNDIESVKQYLTKRNSRLLKNKNMFNVVFDITNYCNLKCLGCGTNSLYYRNTSKRNDPSLFQLNHAFSLIKEYCDSQNLEPFIFIGGGEPFYRNDITNVIKTANIYFKNNIGIDTNATINNFNKTFNNISKYISYAGISVNGLENYYNWWTNVLNENTFSKLTNTILSLSNLGLNDIIEITIVPTKHNIDQIESLINQFTEYGITNFSIHRNMPIGRMKNLSYIIPNALEYFQLLIMISKFNNVDVHMHHSIEAIHSALLLNENIVKYSKLGNPNIQSSLGIDINGNILFDPWCTDKVFSTISAGNIYSSNNLADNFSNKSTLFYSIHNYINKDNRCYGCQINCSGGSRLAAAAKKIEKENNISNKLLLEAFRSIDPACPLYTCLRKEKNKKNDYYKN